MGYSNSFTLKIDGNVKKTIKVCEGTCQCQFDLNQNFCSTCGRKLIEKEVDADTSDIIKQFVTEYEDGDAGYLLTETGRTNESGSGYDIKNELKSFSKKYPNLIFRLSCQWESGMVSEGEPGTDYFFVKDGVEKKATAKVVYVNPFTQQEF